MEYGIALHLELGSPMSKQLLFHICQIIAAIKTIEMKIMSTNLTKQIIDICKSISKQMEIILDPILQLLKHDALKYPKKSSTKKKLDTVISLF